MSVARHHADWLSLVEVSGPFVSLPVLMRAFPQGLEPRDPAQAKLLRAAYEEWQTDATAAGRQREWVLHVLTALLGYPQNQITEGQTLPVGLEANIPEMGETLRPDFALVGPAGTATAGQPQLLIASYPAEQGLDQPVIGKHWKATPATRMMELLHTANVPLGLVTNGEQWMLVYAPRGETTGYTSWYAVLWLDEPITLRAFHSLLGVRRFFGVAADSTLLALLKESASDQQEVTDQLGYQVREAVEVLVQAFDALERESQLTCLNGIAPATVYDAALTIMMRLVFLFSAEERGLLHLGEPLYDNNYAISRLQEQLQEVADHFGEEVLERRYDAWARLLATFRAVHGGIQHQDLFMQAYGGSLFDPDRYPFLEGRSTGSQWRSTTADPLAVNNRVVLHLLSSLQRLRTKVGGGMAETRRVSFRALGVEQIGHVYEGLLDHTAVRASEVTLGVRGTRSKEPEIALSTLEALLAQGEDKLLDHLKDATGRSLSALRKELHNGGLLDEHKLLLACNQDEVLLARLRPFVGLIREDSFERPWVVLPGSVFVTEGSTRRSTGTHYTPTSLTEPIVQHTLEPLVFIGPAEGLPREQWKLKSPKEILDLKVCDMAMGSGAFLVQACRYLAERLVEAWENEEKTHPDQVLTTPEGQFSDGSARERLIPIEATERVAIARRIVADRCLYGVDINAMAVEMAKLSMWLITVDAKRPFTFLDHAFKCGDSLLGITSLEQLENFSLRPGGGKQQAFSTLNLRRHIEEAKNKREALEAMPSDTPEQIAAKAALYAEAEELVSKLSAVADALVAFELKGLKGKNYDAEREAQADRVMTHWVNGMQELEISTRRHMSGRKYFHWALEFPEVFECGGFGAIIGNPPFIAGTAISSTHGVDYKSHLKRIWPHIEGRADICVIFMLRGVDLSRAQGTLGLVASKTASETDSRISGPAHLLRNGVSIYRAIKSMPWPSTASVHICQMYYFNGGWGGEFMLDGKKVSNIGSSLTEGADMSEPFLLFASKTKSFTGTKVYGNGFVLSSAEAEEIILSDPSSIKVVKPYLIGKELNDDPDCRPARFIIDFSEMSQKQAQQHGQAWKIVEDRVKDERQSAPEERMRTIWWQFQRPRKELYARLAETGIGFVVAATSDTVAFVGIPFSEENPIVFSHAVNVLVLQGFGEFSVVQSSLHGAWARKYGSSLKGDFRYTTTDCFENFPLPQVSIECADIGRRFHQVRQQAMIDLDEGLTKIHNRINSYDKTPLIEKLRSMLIEMDMAVSESYGWRDINLDHDFYETNRGIRFTISDCARREVLARLLTLNHERHAEEQANSAAQVAARPANRGRKKKGADGQAALDF